MFLSLKPILSITSQIAPDLPAKKPTKFKPRLGMVPSVGPNFIVDSENDDPHQISRRTSKTKSKSNNSLRTNSTLSALPEFNSFKHTKTPENLDLSEMTSLAVDRTASVNSHQKNNSSIKNDDLKIFSRYNPEENLGRTIVTSGDPNNRQDFNFTSVNLQFQ